MRNTATRAVVGADRLPNQDTDESQFPVKVNGHTIQRINPEGAAYGSADSNVQFVCDHCGEQINPYQGRTITDAEWAENYFDVLPCEK